MIFAFLLLPLFTYAHIIQDDVSITEKIKFDFQTVCQKMVKHETPLIDVVSGTELDCMGKKISVSLFCQKQLVQDPYYLRAYIDQEEKKVVCVTGKKVIFKYLCVKLSDKKLCDQEAKKSCQFIKEKLARRLDTVHTSFTVNDKGIKQLNCYFESLPPAKKI